MLTAEVELTKEELGWLASAARQRLRKLEKDFARLKGQDPSERRDALLRLTQRKLRIAREVVDKTAAWRINSDSP